MENNIIEILEIHFYLNKDKFVSEKENKFSTEDISEKCFVHANWIAIKGQIVRQQENNICNEYYCYKFKKYNYELSNDNFEELFNLFIDEIYNK